MKLVHLATLACAALLVCCGPSESELRSELYTINLELMAIRDAAYQHQSRLGQAEFDMYLGSFAAGYGAVSGDYGLAGDGLQTAVQSERQYNYSSYSLDQLKSRYEVLVKRRQQIISDLN